MTNYFSDHQNQGVYNDPIPFGSADGVFQPVVYFFFLSLDSTSYQVSCSPNIHKFMPTY